MLDVDFKRQVRNRSIAVQEAREDILAWYMAMSGGVPPKQQCEIKKPHDSEVHWYLEPPIPGVENPILIEQEKLQGAWTLRIEAVQPVIRSFCK